MGDAAIPGRAVRLFLDSGVLLAHPAVSNGHAIKNRPSLLVLLYQPSPIPRENDLPGDHPPGVP